MMAVTNQAHERRFLTHLLAATGLNAHDCGSKHVTDMADNTIKTTPKDSYGPIVLSGTILGASHE